MGGEHGARRRDQSYMRINRHTCNAKMTPALIKEVQYQGVRRYLDSHAVLGYAAAHWCAHQQWQPPLFLATYSGMNGQKAQSPPYSTALQADDCLIAPIAQFLNAEAAAARRAVRAALITSPRVKMPTSRPSSSTTGKRRTCASHANNPMSNAWRISSRGKEEASQHARAACMHGCALTAFVC